MIIGKLNWGSSIVAVTTILGLLSIGGTPSHAATTHRSLRAEWPALTETMCVQHPRLVGNNTVEGKSGMYTAMPVKVSKQAVSTVTVGVENTWNQGASFQVVYAGSDGNLTCATSVGPTMGPYDLTCANGVAIVTVFVQSSTFSGLLDPIIPSCCAAPEVEPASGTTALFTFAIPCDPKDESFCDEDDECDDATDAPAEETDPPVTDPPVKVTDPPVTVTDPPELITDVPQGTNPPMDPRDTTGGGKVPEGGGYGDPHFKTWHGRVYDFHGECDLVLTKSSSMAAGKGVEVQVRTVIRRDWSFIAEAAIKIGDDVLEIGDHAAYYINGVEGEPSKKNKDLYSIGGYPTKYFNYGTRRHKFEIDLGTTGKILIKIYNEFLAVSVEDANLADFSDAVGLMGSHETGQLLGRNGQEILDTKAYGFEWQVRDNESLFHEAKGPQYPTLCRMPSAKAIKRRRLLESMVSYKEAEKACEGFEEEARESCIFDVLSTGDLSMADAGAM